MKISKIALNWFLALASVMAFPLIAEIAVRGYHVTMAMLDRITEDPPPFHIVIDSPVLYVLNPEVESRI